MAIVSGFHSIVGNKSVNDAIEMAGSPVDDSNPSHVLADQEASKHSADQAISKEDASPNENAQTGVRKIEAVTLAWGRGSL